MGGEQFSLLQTGRKDRYFSRCLTVVRNNPTDCTPQEKPPCGGIRPVRSREHREGELGRKPDQSGRAKRRPTKAVAGGAKPPTVGEFCPWQLEPVSSTKRRALGSFSKRVARTSSFTTRRSWARASRDAGRRRALGVRHRPWTERSAGGERPQGLASRANHSTCRTNRSGAAGGRPGRICDPHLARLQNPRNLRRRDGMEAGSGDRIPGIGVPSPRRARPERGRALLRTIACPRPRRPGLRSPATT